MRQTARLEYGMIRSFPAALLALVFFAYPVTSQSQSAAADAQQKSAWEAALEARRQELIDKNGQGTDTALSNQLVQMGEQDQTARGFLAQGKTLSSVPEIKKMSEVDAQLTRELKQIVEQKGWPTIALVGIKASNAAMLVLTHTADHAWQLQLLPQLQELADANKIDASSLALVVDKELVSEGKMQRYGSQFKFFNGELAMYAVADPGGLDERRAKALLPPMDEYRKMLVQMYHFNISNNVVMPTKPQSK